MSTHSCLSELKQKPVSVCVCPSCHIMSHLLLNHFFVILEGRALEIWKSESVQPMTMTSSMSPFPKKKICVYHLSRKLMTIGSPITPFK